MSELKQINIQVARRAVREAQQKGAFTGATYLSAALDEIKELRAQIRHLESEINYLNGFGPRE